MSAPRRGLVAATGKAATVMAKKKANKVQKVEEIRETWSRKPLVFQMRGNPEWKAWVDRAAKFNRTTVANLFDMAVSKFVRESGFKEEPPER